jgi:hypothetical protein
MDLIALHLRSERDRRQARDCCDSAERAHRPAIAEVSKQDRHRRIPSWVQVPATFAGTS